MRLMLLCVTSGRWSPDSRHILTTSEFQLRLTVWSLVSTACVHVPWPKHPTRAISFTKDGKYIGIGTRRDCRDYIHLLACQGWEAMGNFEVGTSDLADLEWSPTDSTIAVWDSPLEYKVLFGLTRIVKAQFPFWRGCFLCVSFLASSGLLFLKIRLRAKFTFEGCQAGFDAVTR